MPAQRERKRALSEPTDEQVSLAVGTLKLLADPTRLRIIWALLHGEHSVNELADHVGGQAASVSQHLAKLRLARLVKTRRDGTRIFYETQDIHVRQLMEEALFHADHVGRQMQDHGPDRPAPVGRHGAEPSGAAKGPGAVGRPPKGGRSA